MSWNVHGLTRDKRDDAEFVKILSQNDIVFLYETWTNANSNVDLSGFVSHNFYRKFQHRNAKRASGGIVLYYRDSIKDGVSVVKNHYDSIIWVKLDKTFFELENDMYICGVYLWGENSPAYNAVNVNLFDIIENDVTYYKNLGCVYLNGDFNAKGWQ